MTTVSRVLSPKRDYPVAVATRDRVMAAAAVLQYAPSALERAPVTRRSIATLLHDHADALILFGGEFVDPRRAPGRGGRGLAGEHAGLGTIDVDQRRAAADMTGNLIELGHRRIAFIADTLLAANGVATAGTVVSLIAWGDSVCDQPAEHAGGVTDRPVWQ